VFLILIAFSIVLGLILSFVHQMFLRTFVNSVVTGTLISPFLALVATLLYYRLTAAHAGQPYTPTGSAGAPVQEPPYPTMPPPPSPEGFGTPPGPAAADPMGPGSTQPFPTSGPAEPEATEPWSPPGQSPDAPPPPSTP
jgi:hypothetical protein